MGTATAATVPGSRRPSARIATPFLIGVGVEFVGAGPKIFRLGAFRPRVLGLLVGGDLFAFGSRGPLFRGCGLPAGFEFPGLRRSSHLHGLPTPCFGFALGTSARDKDDRADKEEHYHGDDKNDSHEAIIPIRRLTRNPQSSVTWGRLEFELAQCDLGCTGGSDSRLDRGPWGIAPSCVDGSSSQLRSRSELGFSLRSPTVSPLNEEKAA